VKGFFMGLPEGSCYLKVNTYHKKGDNRPCMTCRKFIIKGIEYKAAIWAPKDGKDSYFMRLDPLNEDEYYQQQQTNNQANKPNETNPAPQRESESSELF
jgi:hypothetical protein